MSAAHPDRTYPEIPPWQLDPYGAPETDTQNEHEPPLTTHMVDGASFVLDIPPDIPAVWGEGRTVAWAQGEALIIAGGSGVGKTTIAGQLLRARLGITTEVLGLPVQATGGNILYLAMDRPSQAQRALSRIFTEDDRDVLADRVLFWRGPPPLDLARDTTILAQMCRDAKADTVIVDSLKDAAIGLSEDEVGAGWNRSRQRVLAEDIQILELHHNVKRGTNGAAPNTLADVYGSTWITNGAGSVIGLHGEAGDVLIEMRHLKQPMEEIGPWTLTHDHDQGVTAIQDRPDILDLARRLGMITAQAAATALFSAQKPTAPQVEKARRKLRKLTESGLLTGPEIVEGGHAVYRPRTHPDQEDRYR
jgi:hypothetical protein